MSGANSNNNGSSPELVYLPEPSWYPPLVALGITAIVGSLFTWWPYGVAGAIVAIVAAIGWARQSHRAYESLPREQRVTLGNIPPSTLQRPGK